MPGVAQCRMSVPGQCKLHRAFSQSTLAVTRTQRPTRRTGAAPYCLRSVHQRLASCVAQAHVTLRHNQLNLATCCNNLARLASTLLQQSRRHTAVTDQHFWLACRAVYCESSQTRSREGRHYWHGRSLMLRKRCRHILRLVSFMNIWHKSTASN